MIVLALDPGETTGYFKALVETNSIVPLKGGVYDSMEAFEHIYIQLFDRVSHVVMEDYRIYPGQRNLSAHTLQRPYAVEEIGRLRWICSLFRIPEVHFQMASEAKGRWPDTRMLLHYSLAKKLNVHTRDAFRHLLTYVETELKLQLWAEGTVL